jgi:hypothetical protein
MTSNRNVSDYLQKASIYDSLAQYYKYTHPNLHIYYYLKHLHNVNKALQMRNNQQQPLADAMVRFLHTSPDAPNIDIYINGQLTLKNLPFKQISTYLPLKAGKYHIDIYPTGNMVDSVLNKKITVEPGMFYTLAAIEPVNKLRLLIYNTEPAVPTNESKIRFIHLARDVQPLDFAVKDRDVVFPNVPYKKTSEYLGLTPMTVDLELREAGTKNVTVSMPKAQFMPNSTYSIILISKDHPEVLVIKD